MEGATAGIFAATLWSRDCNARRVASRCVPILRSQLASTLRAVAAWLDSQARSLGEDHAPADPGTTTASLKVERVLELTRRERQVAALIALGRSNREIGAQLVIATSTAERHVANILAKLEMRSRAQIAAWAAVQPDLVRPN